MKNLKFQSVFDIIGPVMVGPSSSHTAGAVRIGKIVSAIFGETPTEVEFQLFNSFAKTYRGHGTDVALVAGILGMETDDPDIHALWISHTKKALRSTGKSTRIVMRHIPIRLVLP